MKDIFKKYPMQEGESMGKWQHRVSRQIYEEQYADKTPEQMQKILAQYKKEHPDEFEGNNARLISPAFSALFDRLRELNMENAIFENKPKSIFRRLPEQSKEKVKTPKEILDDVSINTYMREINVNILAPSYKFILSARQEGNEEFLKDAGEAISNNLGKRGPGRFYIRDGVYNVEVYDTPEVRKALEAVFEKHGLDTSLLKQQEATNGRRPANAGITKQPNPTVRKAQQSETGQTEGGVSNKTCNIEGFSFEQTKGRLRMMFVKSEESVQFYKKLKESILKQCEGVKPGRLCFKDCKGGMALFTVPNSPEVREAMKVVYEEYGLDTSLLKQSEIKKVGKTSKQSEEGEPSKTDKGQPKKEEPAKITTVLSQYGATFSFGNNVKTNSDGTTFTVDMRKKPSKTIGTGTMSMDQLIKYTKGKGGR